MKLKARRDSNHQHVRDLLRSMGCVVEDLASFGGGVSDLFVRTPRHRMWWVEIKDGSLPPSKRRLTPGEEDFARKWDGFYAVVTGEEDARTLATKDGAFSGPSPFHWWLHCKDPKAAAASVGVRL